MEVEVIAAIGATALVGTTLWLLAAGIADRRSAPRATPGWTPQSVLEAAFLVGGPRRVVDTVISSMHEDERVQVIPHGRLQVLRPVAADGVESAVLAACGPEWQAELKEVRAAAMRSPAVQEIGDGLAAHGLLYRPDSIRHWRLAARVQRSTCYLTCVAMIVSPMAMSRSTVRWEPPNMFPAFMVFFGAMGALLIGGLLAPGGRLTKAGRDAVAQLRRSNPWAPKGTAASGPAVPALVAIGGAEVLTPGPLRDELMASVAVAGAGQGFFGGSGSSSSSSSSSSDPGGATWCGSSGGGGGGCGASSCGSGSGGGGGSSCGGSSGGSGSSCSSGSS
jgi:uncharacterized protein (TIGR04222 family)